jgi:hypothetical protein
MPRWVLAILAVVVALVVMGASFAVGYQLRDTGRGGTSCARDDVYGVLPDRTAALDRYLGLDAPEGSAEEQQALDESPKQDDLMDAMLARCFAK